MFKIRPIDNEVSSAFGERIINGKAEFHSGIDIRARLHTSILAVADGRVIWSNSVEHIVKDGCGNVVGGYGFAVVIKHLSGISTLYGHLREAGANFGRKVEEGEIIGFSGNTGRSTAPHLHFEVIDEVGTKSIEKWGLGGFAQDGHGKRAKNGRVALGLVPDSHRLNPEDYLPKGLG